MSQYYYLNQSNQAQGPCTLDELQQMAAAGTISDATLLNAIGTANWVPLAQVRQGGGVGDRKEQQPPKPSVVAEVLQRAWDVFKKLAGDPVGRLPAAAQELGPALAQSVGIAFGAVFMVSIVLTANFSPIMRHLARSQFFQVLVVSATPFVCIVATIALTRVIFKGKGVLGTDCLVAGTALLPFALLAPLLAVLGAQNSEVSLLLTAVAMSTCYLLLYSGCTGVNQLTTRAATLAMPIILLGSGWLASIIMRALIKQKEMGSSFPF
jgi:hypothetical protein